VHTKNIAINWESFVREIFMEYHYRQVRNTKLKGEIEIDESLFGRRLSTTEKIAIGVLKYGYLEWSREKAIISSYIL
jgi:hypothetical protein